MKRRLILVSISALVLLGACGGKGHQGQPASAQQAPNGPQVVLEPFLALAKQTDCSEVRSRLFLIDKKKVFWERQGECPDNSYAQVLYGSTPQEVLCERMDSVTGPHLNYRDESSRAMFDIMIANLDKADLGLGLSHSVEPIPF